MEISLVIPCFNEEKNLPFLIKKLKKILSNPNFEVILVDNGSLDNTSSLMNTYKLKYKNLRCLFLNINKGYGGGIIEGLRLANGHYLAWTHADMQTDPEDILEAQKFISKNDEAIFIKGLRKGRPISDRFFTLGMSIYASILLKEIFRDINAQPTIFPSEFFKSWVNPPTDFSIDLYAYSKAKKMGYLIKRFPVNFDKRLFGVSSWNINFKEKFKFIKRTLKYIKTLSKVL